MLSPFLSVLAKPAIAGSIGKLVTIEKLRAISSDGGDLKIGADNRLLVSITGQASSEDKMAYCKVIEFSKLFD